MSWVVRPARPEDLDALLALAGMAGDGMTNLPADRDALAARLDWACRSLEAGVTAPVDELYLLVLEDEAGRLGGTAMLFSRLGARWPFYSFKLNRMSLASKELGRIVPHSVLNLVTDHDGASEVGGLFLHPALRAGGLGRLLARARYLFVALHRARFGGRMVAELRGVVDAAGNSPFWDAVGAKFFGMGFPEADRFNAVHGSQFIADLMPRHPIHVALLPDAAQAVIGVPHVRSRGALAMLKAEGFCEDNYLDIFDGGPTLVAQTNGLRTLREARTGRAEGDWLCAAGRLGDFRAWRGDGEAEIHVGL